MEFEVPTSSVMSGAIRVLDKYNQLKGSHNFQSWFLDIKTAVQIISCDILLTNEHPP